MRTLVTGGAGFIGSTLVDRLLAEGHSVDVIDDLSTGSLANLAEARRPADTSFTFHQIDIRSPGVVELIARRRPEVVFHLAAQADVRVSVARPAFDAEVNILGSLNVLEGARAGGARKVVFASSGGTIYGDPDPSDLPVKESHPQRPLSPYGVAKKAVGDYLVAYRAARPRVHGPGPGQRLRPPPGSARRGGRGRHLRRPPARRVSRAPSSATAPRPATSSSSTTWSTPSPGPPTKGGGLLINIGTGVETSVNELYATDGRRRRPWPRRPVAPDRPGELQRSALDPGRAAIHLGWKPWTTLRRAAGRLRWFRDRPDHR